MERASRVGDGVLAIAVDGKVLHGAWTDANDQVTLFSAMTHREAVTVVQLRVPDGTNEVTQVKELLGQVADDGQRHVIITLDAAHTQRQTPRLPGRRTRI